MRVVIVGAGAMGSLFGCLLYRAGKDVWLFDKQLELVRAVKRKGIQVEGVSGEYHHPVPITANLEDLSGVELFIILVKSYDTARAVSEILPLVGSRTKILTLQNGVGNAETIEAVTGPDRTLAGTTAQGATLLGPGHIRHAGTGETIIGGLNGKRMDCLEEIRTLFESSGIATQISHDINGLLWSKLLINAGINALTGVTGLRNGELLDFTESREIMRRTVQETVKIVNLRNIRLGYQDPVAKVELVCRATANNISSLLQDLRNRKQTEIDYINGAIVSAGYNLGIAAPINRALTDLVHVLEN